MRIRTHNLKNQGDTDLLDAPETTSAINAGALFMLFVVLLLFFGLSVLYSQAGQPYFIKQLIWTGVGTFAFLVCVFSGYRFLGSMSPFMLAGLVIMLLLPVTVMRHAINGAYRWIVIGSFRIQPSEFAKLIMVLFWGTFLAKHSRAIENNPFKKVCIPMYGSFFFIAMLIMLGRDLGTTCLIGGIFFLILFAARLPWYYVMPLPCLGLLCFIGINTKVVQGILFKIGILTEYRLARIISYQDPESYQTDDGYQLWNSLLALGSGKWTGLGFGESRIKRKYLPEAHTDFILSIVGEEFGFVIMILLMIIYMLLAWAGFTISAKARTRQGELIAFGMTSFIVLQAIINIGVICGALPTKGMPAPFISYGGSSLITCLAAAGIILSVAIDNTYPDYPETLGRKLAARWRKFTTGSEKKGNDHGSGK